MNARTAAVLLATGLLSSVAAPLLSAVQSYPSHTVRILTSIPGEGNDFIARIVAPALSNQLGESVIVDNRASAMLGPLGAQAAPDGYTLIIAGSTFQFVPLLEKNAQYDPIKDFEPISQIERAPNVLVVSPALAVSSVKELVARANGSPSKLKYGSGGTGGSLHLAGEMFKQATATNIVRVPYKSTGLALMGLLGHEVDLIFSTPGGAMPHVNSGKLKALAVTGSEPSALAPGVPTMSSQGFPGFEIETMGFLIAPAGTPAAIINRLNRETRRIVAAPEVKQRMLAWGCEAVSSTPAQLEAKLKSDDARMRKLFKSLGLLESK